MSSMIIPTVRNATLPNECDGLREELNDERKGTATAGEGVGLYCFFTFFFPFVNSFLYSF